MRQENSIASDETDNYTTEKLIHAVQWGDINYVEHAIEKYGFSADSHDRDNCSLLHWAAINNRLEIARYLIRKNANINSAGGNNCEIPLQWAARNAKCCRMVHLLIAEGSNITHKSIYGLDALFIATQSNHLNIAFIILNAGADPNTEGPDGDTPLYALLRKYHSYASADADDETDTIDMQRLLIRAKASVTHKDKDGRTAMHILASAKVTDFKSLFLIYDAGSYSTMRDKDKDGMTPYKVHYFQHYFQFQMAFKLQCGILWWLQIATNRKHSRMLRFFGEAFLYKRFPSYFPIAGLALLFAGFFASIQYFGAFWGCVAYVPGYMSMGVLVQGSIARASSRASCGFAWGIIVTLLTSYIVFFMPENLLLIDYSILGLAATTAATLSMTSRTDPHHLYGDRAECRYQEPSIKSTLLNHRFLIIIIVLTYLLRDRIVEQILQCESSGAEGTRLLIFAFILKLTVEHFLWCNGQEFLNSAPRVGWISRKFRCTVR